MDKPEEKAKTKVKAEPLVMILLVAAIGILAFNEMQILSIGNTNVVSAAQSSTGGSVTNALSNAASALSVLPTGIPAVYGAELDVSYDDVSADNPQSANAAIGKLANLDKSITLSGDLQQRYIDIASQISCEYCCGAKAIIFDNGQPACGCAHSYAMRGLAKYLLTEHPELSDEQILEEMGKWKVLFFPGVHEQKAQVMQQQGIEMNYINLASNKYRGIEKGATGGSMVGGC